jgi:hypothetical protein
MNINDYTGRRYDFRKYNCWHHVLTVRADIGIETPRFDVAAPSDADAMFTEGFRDSRGLVRADTPQDFDAVLMGARHGSRIVWHSGVYYEGYVSHCELAARQVKLESLADIRARFQEIQFWR